jgi:hypothetical protein
MVELEPFALSLSKGFDKLSQSLFKFMAAGSIVACGVARGCTGVKG